ncbi:MAG: hydantoinase/oxoprolinase [Candidatus Eremiobacteraeota bacterium]|nr:hydantoinase/oxoprolinase [Candidatus Eremiobacteraeota bacterium]
MQLRIGIDVGGTFTDIVAIESARRRIVARVKVPTTHEHPDGVAAGIVDGIRHVLTDPSIAESHIAFIAHSTTQATNALLEGDVARVGIVTLVDRWNGAFVRGRAALRAMTLAPGATFAPAFASAGAYDPQAQQRAVDGLISRGCSAIAATAAFGVDRARLEDRVVEYARHRGIDATSGHDVASTYGLRARTRTAALNAAILPTMVRTARMTARAASDAGIAAPLMIMRSDGGVMDVREVERRPILTMLSGPAAGIAGALLHERVTDGIFIEVGGTSSDVSVIRRGRPQMRPARVGGHRTLLRTLDVRTLAVAGGSLLRIDGERRGRDAIRDVGPRSAHIAGMRYASYTPAKDLEDATLQIVAPREGDAPDCVALVTRHGERVGITPTCAANMLGFVSEGAFAFGDPDAVAIAFARIGERLGLDGMDVARVLLERACTKLRRTVEALIAEYQLDMRAVDLIGGGGGAAALVPFLARTLGLPHRLARDAEVISPIGVALALVRDSVERTIANPTPEDILGVRREAIERVVAAGAAPDLVEVSVELEPRKNLVRATASGATEASAEASDTFLSPGVDVATAAARALHVDVAALERKAAVEHFTAFAVLRRRREPAWLPLAPKKTWTDACIVDGSGVVRLVLQRARIVQLTRGDIARTLPQLLDEETAFGDVGRSLPDCALVYARRVVDLSGLAESPQVVALAEEELRGLDQATQVVVVLSRRDA